MHQNTNMYHAPEFTLNLHMKIFISKENQVIYGYYLNPLESFFL